ncbi:hypothetical protein GCK32_004745, partial [Trichostrongylus colubriformis]
GYCWTKMNCSDTQDLIRDVRFLAIVGAQALTGFISIITSSMVLKRCGSLYFHLNCRICMVLQLCTVIERAIALWKRSRYDSFGPKIGITLVAASIFIAVLSTAWAMGEEDFTQRYAYCSPITAKTAEKIMLVLFSSCGVSALTIAGVTTLLILNSSAKKRSHFSLVEYRIILLSINILIASTLIIFVVHSIFITGLQLSTVIERATALWKRSQYDLFGPKIGIALVAASVLLAVLSTVWAMGEEDFSQSYAYCSPVTANTTKNMMVMIFASSGISASTILSTAILLIFNSFAKKRERFDLQTSYQLCENDSVLRVLIPLEIFQAIVSGFVTTSGIIIMMLRSQMTVVNFRVLLVAIN